MDEHEMERIEEEWRTGCEKIKQGHKRVVEKNKNKRQIFWNPITNGRRSGSGKIVLEHYDTQTNLFSVSTSVEPFNFGLESSLYFIFI